MNKTFLLVFCFISYFSTTVSATTLIVYNTSDSDVLSLRERISTASPNDTITFAPLINGNAIMLTSQLIIDKPLVIIGNGIDSTIIDGSADNNFRLLNITSSCKITGITFQNGGGDVSGTTNTNLWGGAIYFNNSAKVLTVSNCLFKENKAYLGGAIRIQEGDMEIISSSFKNNESFKFGGAINTRNTTTNSQSIDNSLFEANATGDGGGAIFQETGSELTIRNCTFVKNTSNTTGGGVKRAGTSNLNILNTLFYNNTALTGGPDLSASSVAYQFNNFLGDYSGSSLTSGSNGNITGNPSFIGGMTGDYRLRFDSPCVNAGNDTLLTPDITEDLNGMARLQADTIDIGAYEFQEQLYVKADANGINNGGKWDNAFQDLQNALKNATKGTKIWVAKGTYKPTTNTDRTVSFVIPDSVKVYGSFAGNEGIGYNLDLRNFTTYETILSGNIGTNADSTDNTHHVVFTQYVSPETLVDGFTISEGNAIDDPNYGGAGGGWINYGSGLGKSSNPTIRNCTFLKNIAVYGGAISNEGDDGGNASPFFINNTFSLNHATYNGGAIYNYGAEGNSSPSINNCSFTSNNSNGHGGAIYNYGREGDSSPSISNSSFTSNEANQDGGAIYNYGAVGKSSPSISNCTFTSNEANDDGGAIYNYGYYGNNSPSISNCAFTSNKANDNGGAIYNDGDEGNSSPSISNSTFTSNEANYEGGAIYNYGREGDSSPSINNCSFTSNNSNGHGGAIYFLGDNGDISAQVNNCIFNDNDDEHLYYDDGNANTQPKFMNCTFYGASTRVIGTLFDSDETPADFTNCIFWGNGGVIVSDTSHVNINYSLVEDVAFTQGPNSGKNNINSDPLFKNAFGGDLSLKPCSPAVDAGTNAGTTALDILGEPRIFGCIKADMGAYEYQGLYKNSAFDLNTVSLDNAGIGSSSTYYGTPIVASDKILKPGVKTLYKAPNAIELNPGFKAEAVQAFETEIGVEACP